MKADWRVQYISSSPSTLLRGLDAEFRASTCGDIVVSISFHCMQVTVLNRRDTVSRLPTNVRSTVHWVRHRRKHWSHFLWSYHFKSFLISIWILRVDIMNMNFDSLCGNFLFNPEMSIINVLCSCNEFDWAANKLCLWHNQDVIHIDEEHNLVSKQQAWFLWENFESNGFQSRKYHSLPTGAKVSLYSIPGFWECPFATKRLLRR